MYAEVSEKKASHARVAFALLCGLAVCCSVMYITADAGDEYIHEVVAGKDAGTSVGSTDVLKAGQIYTETPDGRMRLMDYFNNVEKEIADEVANRKADIASVRAQMARDFAFNAAARATLKKQMLHKMAQNAKIARDNLNTAMRKTQATFARQADLANRRYKATQARDKATSEAIAQDKHEAAQQLTMAVTAWQKSTSAWASATNARIDRMNKHVAANAAQIKENAKKARKDLESTMASWDHKVATFRSNEQMQNNKLSEQFAAQSKATRAWASNKIKGLVAQTAAQFNDVETHMAKNRHEVDMALKQATQRFMAALNAAKALEDNRYAQTVADIAAAKKEAADKVAEASSEFKVSLLTLSSTVAEQVAKVNKRIDNTADTVRSDAAAQAKVNANVNAEMARMIKVGNDRYANHLKDDAELQTLINKDKAETDDKLNKMALEFNTALADVRKTLADDRKNQEDALKKQTSAVWSKLYANQAAQEKKNAEMAAETRRMRLDAMDAVREAKEEFRKKISDLSEVVAENDKKANKKIADLTGVVEDEAAKSKKGRQIIEDLEEANKKELKKAINDAIDIGEKRAQAVEAKGEKMDKDTRTLINMKLNTEITNLREETNASVEKLALLDKEARAKMKAEMLYAVRSAAEVAKMDLDLAIKDGVEKMIAFEEKAAKSAEDSAIARKAIEDQVAANAKEVSRMIRDAVATDAKAQSALAHETAEAIKATNTQLDAYSEQMKATAAKTRADIASLSADTMDKIATQQERAKANLETFTSEDAARQKDAMDFLAAQLKIATEEADQKFGAARVQLAEDRAAADLALGTATNQLNDALAKQAALADSRFSQTVDDLAAARKEAADEVQQFRKDFAVGLVETTAEVKMIEGTLLNEIAKVSGEVRDMKSYQATINEKVSLELARVEKLSNDRFSKSKAARGKLRQLMDENKQAAAEEVAALAAKLDEEVHEMRNQNAANKRAMAQDLSKATETFYEKLSEQQKNAQEETAALNAATEAAAAASAANLKSAQDMFDAKIVGLANQVSSNQKAAERAIARITGVVHDYADAAASDRENIKKETRAMEADLTKALDRAISIGEAKAKAVEQRIASHLKDTQRFLQVELNESVERAADNVLKILEGKRQKIADNYLSLKAYAVASADTIEDYVAKGKGTGLSSIGDLLQTTAALGAVHAPEEAGLGMGGDEIRAVFSGETIKVSNSVATINALVNEYSQTCNQVRERWPMGLGKYLLDKLQLSMQDKGVLQVDKVEGKSGNFVYINGRSVGLSNKLSDFSELASRMSSYESVLAKMTSKITVPKSAAPSQYMAPKIPPNGWQGTR